MRDQVAEVVTRKEEADAEGVKNPPKVRVTMYFGVSGGLLRLIETRCYSQIRRERTLRIILVRWTSPRRSEDCNCLHMSNCDNGGWNTKDIHSFI
jgi:hypothetical protein